MPIAFRYPNLIIINGVGLSDEGRQPIQEERDAREIKVTLASGRIKKYTQGDFKKWTINWDTISMDALHTVDGQGGRNEIRNNIAYTSGPLSMQIQDGKNPIEYYTVFVDSYQETLKYRRQDTFYYTIQLVVYEQG